MAANMTFLGKLRSFLQNLNSITQRFGANPPHSGMFGAPALCFDAGHMTSEPRTQPSTSQSILADIFGPILLAVPRNRRSVEKRRTRKFGEFWFENARPKTNIVICLNCGQPHEIKTICGNCYDKVRKETDKMRAAMGDDTYKFDHPRTEVGYLYKGENLEDFPMYKGRYIVEIDEERPSWFPAQLTKKTRGET